MSEYKYKYEEVLELQVAHFTKLTNVSELLKVDRIEERVEGIIQNELLKSKETKKEFDKIRADYSKIRDIYIKKEKVMTLDDFMKGGGI